MFIIQKKTNNIILADSTSTINAKVCFSAEKIEINDVNYRIVTSFSYRTDENDPGTEKSISCEDILYPKADLITKENSLGVFSGPNITDKCSEMVDKLMDEFLDDKECFGLTSVDWTNV